VSEGACPFCRATFDATFTADPVPVPPALRLSRAALFALGAGALAGVPACGGATSGTPIPTNDAGFDAGSILVDGGTGIPLYGAAPLDGSLIAPPYGITPPPEDAGNGTEPTDAEPDVVIGPPYGLPPYGIPPGH
jgi:hypothetical protein